MLELRENENLNDLILQAQQGDKEAQERIVIGYMPSVNKVLRGKNFDYSRGAKGVEREDLFQVGCMGLFYAVMTFDTTRDIKFLTWAITCINSKMAVYARDVNGDFKMTRGYKDLYKNIVDCRKNFQVENSRKPKLSEMAEILGVKVEKISDTLLAYENFTELDRVKNKHSKEKDVTLGEVIQDHSIADENVILDRVIVKDAMDKLDDRGRKVIYFRYFLNESQEKVGKRLGCKQMTVSRKQKNTLVKLKSYLENKGYYSYENN